METRKNNIGLKVALGIALALFIATGFYTSQLYQQKQETESQLTKEKLIVMDDLSNMARQYDIAISENDIANEKLIDAKERIQGLIDSLKVSEDNVSNNPITYNDNFGFKCLPSGWVNRKGEFSQLGRGIGTSSSLAKFWTETDDDTGKLWCRIFGRRFISHAGEPENGYSVRLIKGDKID